jgi:uncharacterized protein
VAIWPDVLTAFLAGLFGSLHCIGMCGPLASIGCRSHLTKRMSAGPFWFILGKFFSYSILGLMAGLAGSILIGSGLLGRAISWVSIGGGALMLIILLLSHLNLRIFRTSMISGGISRWGLRSGYLAPLILGFAAAFLPCGLLYSMVARSAATGNMLHGTVLMQAFGLGTSPALIGIGSLMGVIPQRWHRFGALAGEIVIALSAAVLIWRGMHGLAAVVTCPACCQ